MRKHTSVLLDLKNRAVYYEFLDIVVDESPIVSNTIFRRFVFGSSQAQLTFSGKKLILSKIALHKKF